MSDKRPSQSDDMSDQALSELYRQAPKAKSPALLDDKVLARAAAQADRIHHTSRYAEVRRPVFLARQWVTLAATACVITLSISLVIQMPDKQPWMDSSFDQSVVSEKVSETVSETVSESEAIVVAERKQAPLMKSRVAEPAAPESPKEEHPPESLQSMSLQEVVVTANDSAAESLIAADESADVLIQEYDREEAAFSRALRREKSAEKKTAAEQPKLASPSVMREALEEKNWHPVQWIEQVLALWRDDKRVEAAAMFSRYKEAYPAETSLKDVHQTLSQQDQAIINQLQLQWQQKQKAPVLD